MSWLIRLLQEEGVGGNAPNLLLHLKGDERSDGCLYVPQCHSWSSGGDAMSWLIRLPQEE